MQSTRADIDALIVGAGPTGLVMAIDLARRGLRCRVIDQLAEPAVYSKAQIIHARTLELLHRDGLAGELLSRGITVHGMSIYTPELKRLVHATFEPVSSRYEYMLSIPQHDTEQVLAAFLAERGVQIERGVRLDRFSQEEGFVSAALVPPSGGEQHVRTSYLLGCDGAHSTVRKGLALPFEGAAYEQRIIQADVRIDWPFAHEHDEVVVFVADKGLLGVFPLPGDRRYRMLTFLDPEEPMEPVLPTFQRLMDERGPKGSIVSDPAWMVDFRIHRRMVPQYRVGRVFLAGDAAHIHSPAGGQGMNTGMQDAMNLAWKLALVHRGEGQPELLASYDAERHPVAAATLQGTDTATQAFARVFALRHPIALALRRKLFEFVGSVDLFSRVGRLASMLEIAYPDSPAVAQDRGSPLTLPSTRDAEPPGLRDWMDFGSGPAPGSRTPDVVLASEDATGARLFDAFDHPGHTLLLFDGAVHSEAGYQNLANIARTVTERHAALVVPQIVIPLDRRPDALPADAPVLLDPEGAVHRAYGARGECLYLVRPDGHVAYRCQPARLDLLGDYLSRVLV
jgi:2-polyprenyl-6-methoxyphenol hydroxylase-like FAD-dependent oxidoreductase